MYKAEFEFQTSAGRYWNSGVRTFADKRHADNWSRYMLRKNPTWKEVGFYEHE